MNIIATYKRVAEAGKWLVGKAMLFLGFLTAIDIVTGYTSMTPVFIVLSGIFMVSCIATGFILDTNLLVGKIKKGR